MREAARKTLRKCDKGNSGDIVERVRKGVKRVALRE